MSIFEVLSEHYDMCGNSSAYHHAFVCAETIEDVERVFPRGRGLSHFVVCEVDVQPLPTEVQVVPREPR